MSLRDFVLTIMANVAAYYTVKCLDWFITLGRVDKLHLHATAAIFPLVCVSEDLT